MNTKEYVLDSLKRNGLAVAKALQERAEAMTGTELYAEEDYIPDFKVACAKMNMLERPIGFVCRSSAGRVVKLLQVYDSTVYTQEPEELVAQWGFKWSTDPTKALPFVSISTSPYMKDDCCTEDGETFRSLMDNNVHAPSVYPQGWEKVEREG